MRTVTLAERRARLARRHRLAEPAADPEDVVTALVAVHSSDPTSVFLSMWSRIPGFSVGDLERLLYDERTLVRHWGMRRTLWVVSRTLLPAVVGSSTNAIGKAERRRTIKLIEDGGVAIDGEAWLDEMLPKTIEAIRTNGEVFTRHLSTMVPGLADKITFTNKAGQVTARTGMASRALVQLGMESRVVRARPAGTWVSGQYSWAVIEDWLGGPIHQFDVREASARVVDLYLRSSGPVTETDVRWWTGWTAAQTRAGLADVGAVEVDIEEGGTGYLHPEDLDPVEDPVPWVSLVPSLDSTTMGWKERDWYMGRHGSILFDRNGNAGPTIWSNGKVVGGWAQRKDGEIAYEVFEDVGTDVAQMIEARAAQLRVWMGETVITPRFRSPHDLHLAR